jgi:pentatricopeptide repeat protein
MYTFQISNFTHIVSRPYLLRDAYDDMILDGVQPVRDTFHSLIIGTMKGSRLQDALYFRDQMKEMGLQPDVGPLSLLNSFHLIHFI